MPSSGDSFFTCYQHYFNQIFISSIGCGEDIAKKNFFVGNSVTNSIVFFPQSLTPHITTACCPLSGSTLGHSPQEKPRKSSREKKHKNKKQHKHKKEKKVDKKEEKSGVSCNSVPPFWLQCYVPSQKKKHKKERHKGKKPKKTSKTEASDSSSEGDDGEGEHRGTPVSTQELLQRSEVTQ